MMELKQLAESITMIAFTKKIPDQKKNIVYFKNRPRLWSERIENPDPSTSQSQLKTRQKQ